jgi:mRNA-degrading endonuclease toxin of MazEF toxin-antitoxin module
MGFRDDAGVGRGHSTGLPATVTASAPARPRQRVLVAPVTRHVRGVQSELPVGTEGGLPVESAASFDNLRPFPKAMLVRRLGSLGPRLHEICITASAALDC